MEPLTCVILSVAGTPVKPLFDWKKGSEIAIPHVSPLSVSLPDIHLQLADKQHIRVRIDKGRSGGRGRKGQKGGREGESKGIWDLVDITLKGGMYSLFFSFLIHISMYIYTCSYTYTHMYVDHANFFSFVRGTVSFPSPSLCLLSKCMVSLSSSSSVISESMCLFLFLFLFVCVCVCVCVCVYP